MPLLLSISKSRYSYFRLNSSNDGQIRSPSTQRRNKLSGPSKLQKRCLIYGTLVFLIALFLAYEFLTIGGSHKTSALDDLALAVGLHNRIYAVIIDAGSTGSRILALSFHQSVIDGSLKLDAELFIAVEPGLSSYASNPKEGAQKLKELLEKAKEFIPENAWSKTPLAVRATAGLRLLPVDQAEALLQSVRQMFEESPFRTNANSVAIMDGTDEGLFSWFNVNFLLDKLFGNPANTLAALDLGGGSTQITFAPWDPTRLMKESPQNLKSVHLLSRQISVYTRSYLGLGLMAARKEILKVENPRGATDLRSECINPIIKGKKWKYGGVEYTVQGPLNPEILKRRLKGSDTSYESIPVVRIKECSAIITQYIKTQDVEKPVELLQHSITAFSYFFDRATETGLIDPFIGGTVTVRQFHKTAETVCHTPNVDQPFMCLDLLFITILFEDGYGLSPETEIKLVKQIDGHEVSWSLGAAFHILQNGL